MKTLVAGMLVAATMTLALPAPASAIGVYLGPGGGVRVGVGRPLYRRPFVARRPVVVVPRRGVVYGRRPFRRF